MNFLKPSNIGVVCIILSGLCYGFMAFFGLKITANGNSAYNMIFWRFAISLFFYLPVFLLGASEIKKIKKIDLFKIFIYGALFFNTSSVTYFIGAGHIGSGMAMVIFFVYPLIVISFNSLYYREKINKKYYLPCAMTIIGIIMIADIKELKFDVIGIGLSLFSALSYALFIFFTQKITLPARISGFAILSGCMVGSLFFVIMSGTFLPIVNPIIIKNLIGISIISTVIPLFLFSYGLKYVNAKKAAMLMMLEPVCVVIIGVVALGERLAIDHMIGAILVLAGSLKVLRNKS